MKDKDRELRRVVHELTTQIIGELVGYFKDEEGFVIKLEDDAISQIKALYKPLGKERLITILERNQLVQRFIIEHDKDLPTTVMVDLLAQAIINARGEK